MAFFADKDGFMFVHFLILASKTIDLTKVRTSADVADVNSCSRIIANVAGRIIF